MIRKPFKSPHKVSSMMVSAMLTFVISIPMVGLFAAPIPAQVNKSGTNTPASKIELEDTSQQIYSFMTFNRSMDEISPTETTGPAETTPPTTEITTETPAPTPTIQPTPTPVPEIIFKKVSFTLYISAKQLNLRAKPSTDGKIIGQLKYGDKVSCIGENEEWMKVRFNGQTGYLKTEYTSKTMIFLPVKENVYVNVNTLNLRAEPSTDAEIADKLIKSELLTRIGIGDQWSKVKTASGITGYVSTKYLTTVPPFSEKIIYSKADYSNISKTEKDLLTRIVALEGSSRYGYKGYLAIASAILNRVESSRFADTIIGVVSATNQFSTYLSPRTPYINDSVRRAVSDALAGKRILPRYVMYFIEDGCYRQNVRDGGSFSRLSLYGFAYGTAWCYKASDR